MYYFVHICCHAHAEVMNSIEIWFNFQNALICENFLEPGNFNCRSNYENQEPEVAPYQIFATGLGNLKRAAH